MDHRTAFALAFPVLAPIALALLRALARAIVLGVRCPQLTTKGGKP